MPVRQRVARVHLRQLIFVSTVIAKYPTTPLVCSYTILVHYKYYNYMMIDSARPCVSDVNISRVQGSNICKVWWDICWWLFLQIYYRVCKWKDFKNRLTFTGSVYDVLFLTHSVVFARISIIVLSLYDKSNTSLRRSSSDHSTDASRTLLCSGAATDSLWIENFERRLLSTGQIDGRTDTRPLHKPRTACGQRQQTCSDGKGTVG